MLKEAALLHSQRLYQGARQAQPRGSTLGDSSAQAQGEKRIDVVSIVISDVRASAQWLTDHEPSQEHDLGAGLRANWCVVAVHASVAPTALNCGLHKLTGQRDASSSRQYRRSLPRADWRAHARRPCRASTRAQTAHPRHAAGRLARHPRQMRKATMTMRRKEGTRRRRATRRRTTTSGRVLPRALSAARDGRTRNMERWTSLARTSKASTRSSSLQLLLLPRESSQ